MNLRFRASTVGWILLTVGGSGLFATNASGSSVSLKTLVTDAAAQAARAQVAPPDRFEVSEVRFTAASSIPQGEVELKLIDASGPNQAGMVRVTFELIVDGKRAGRAPATVRGVRRGPVLVTRSALPRGVSIDPAQIELVDEDLTRLRFAVLRSVAELEDRVPLRTLGAGRKLTDDLLGPLPIVRRGDSVDLRVQRGRLHVMTKGTVKKDGAVGETVPAENVSTGAEVLARVESDGSLVVVRGAIRGRSR